MRYNIKYFLLWFFVMLCKFSFTQAPTVTPVKKIFYHDDTLAFIFDGLIRNNGASHERPLWGVLKRSENGWDTLINVRHWKTMNASVPYTDFQDFRYVITIIDTLPKLFEDDKIHPVEAVFNNYGEYMLTTLSKDGKEIIYSIPFFIAPWHELRFVNDKIERILEPDIDAEFPGGVKAVMSYFQESLIHSTEELKNEIDDHRVVVRFIVDTIGNIGASVFESVPNCPKCDKEAVRLMNNMPNWTPAKRYFLKPNYENSKKEVTSRKDWELTSVRAIYNMPVKFNLMNNLLLPRGYNAFESYISKNIVYPKKALKKDIEGKVAVKIEFGDTRSIERVSVINGIENCYECNDAILEVLRTIPNTILTLKENTKTPFYFNLYLDLNEILK